MTSPFDQAPFAVRLEWSVPGARQLQQAGAAIVVVDVLSFSTSVSVATDRGMAVVPCPWADPRADALADELGATVARGRMEASEDHPWSLSPAALMEAPVVDVLVLPSPNGSAITAQAAREQLVLVGCVRSAAATARHLVHRGYGTPEAPIGVVAAGERWPDGSLRPAVEDLLGAGAVVDCLVREHGLTASPEAAAAAAAVSVCDLGAALRECASGRELQARGFAGDVTIAAQRDASDQTVELVDGVLRGVRP